MLAIVLATLCFLPQWMNCYNLSLIVLHNSFVTASCDKPPDDFQTIKKYLSQFGCNAGFYGCFPISNKIFYPPYLRGCSTNKRFNSAHPMTKYLWCSDRKTGSPACCFNSVPSEQQDRGSVSAASEGAALLAGYHHKINPQVSSSQMDCSWDRKHECEWQKWPIITLLCS